MDGEQSMSESMLLEAIDSEVFHKLTDKRLVGHWAMDKRWGVNRARFWCWLTRVVTDQRLQNEFVVVYLVTSVWSLTSTFC